MNDILIPGILLFAYISFLWWLGQRFQNAGLIDFGWPSGFTALALYYGFVSDGHWQRKAIITAMYCFCGLRFMVGWIVRNRRDGEDRRWSYFRDRWNCGEGLFGIRSVPINLFAFYHAQTFATLLVLIRPHTIACNNAEPGVYVVEWIAVGLWVFSYIMENVADFQLDQFRKTDESRGVCRNGLWKYSRHPNYFYEFLIWTAYTLFAIPSNTHWMDVVALVLVPLVAYWFLVHFTGIPITEQASLDRRGEPYAEYQATTNRFFPWFPRTSSRSNSTSQPGGNPK
jgi:steroid 5-alpha reductase family enzyme